MIEVESEVSIKAYREEDLTQLERFFREVWSPPPLKKAEEWFQWQVKDNPNAVPSHPTLLLAKMDNKVVGMLVLVPTPLWVNGEAHDVSWGRDLFVDPKFRRHKIGLLLNEMWTENFAAALGSGQSATMRSLQQKHGWSEISKVNQYEKLFFSADFLRKSFREGFSIWMRRALAMLYAQLKTPRLAETAYSVSHGNDFKPEVESLWLTCRAEYSQISSRDFKTLRWRFSNHPYYRYRVSEVVNCEGIYLGYLVTRREGEVCWLIDILTSPDDYEARRVLIGEVEKMYRLEGVHRFVSRSVCAPLESTLKAMGYLQTCFEQFACIKSYQSTFNRNNSEWYITAMDSDMDR